MELLKDIYFNTDKLVENTNVKVSYTGKFYQGDNDKVFIHYGYGKNWDNVQEVEMKKTDLGYQTELNLGKNETINFCFKNQNNEWDNNFGKNYIFNVEKASVNEIGVTTFGTPEASFENMIETPTVEEQASSNAYFKTDFNSILGSSNFNNIITPTANELNTIINPISELTSNKFEQASNIENFPNNAAEATTINAVNQPVTSLTVKKSNSNAFGWTKKVTNSIAKFFASVPKFISGNYKRIIGKNQNKKH